MVPAGRVAEWSLVWPSLPTKKRIETKEDYRFYGPSPPALFVPWYLYDLSPFLPCRAMLGVFGILFHNLIGKLGLGGDGRHVKLICIRFSRVYSLFMLSLSLYKISGPSHLAFVWDISDNWQGVRSTFILKFHCCRASSHNNNLVMP